jgi:hypothetical protein
MRRELKIEYPGQIMSLSCAHDLYTLFVSSESERIDCRKDRKFIEKRASLVWFLCQRGKKH